VSGCREGKEFVNEKSVCVLKTHKAMPGKLETMMNMHDLRNNYRALRKTRE
jgi:hypothetical protein